MDDGLIDVNPVKVEGAGKPSRRRSIEPLTPIQVRAIADGMPDRWRLGVLFGAWCALRSGEVRELRRKDIDLTRGVVKVTRGVVHAGQGGVRVVRDLDERLLEQMCLGVGLRDLVVAFAELTMLLVCCLR